MGEPIKLLEALLLKNLPPEEREGLTLNDDSPYQWFYFDHLEDPQDLEAAWAVFPEQAEIRRRLAEVERVASVLPGWGYRIPTPQALPERRADLVRRHLQSMRPLIPNSEENQATIAALAGELRLEPAPPDIAEPEPGKNWLFLTLYEAAQEPTYELLNRGEHYELLRDWAIYLTKCDEVALYLLWPALSLSQTLPADTPEAGMRLWAGDSRACYWFQDNDPLSGVIVYRERGAHG